MGIAFLGAGAFTVGTAAITPPVFGSTAFDVHVMLLETNTTITVANWTEAGSSPQDESTDGTHLTVFWRRSSVNGPVTSVTSDSGDHQCGQVLSFSGVVRSGTPFCATAGSVDATPAVPSQIPGATTLMDYCMLLYVVGTGQDVTSSTRFASWTNANLASITEATDNTNVIGDGGGFGAAYGILNKKGASGTTTVTQTGVVTDTYWCGALIPEPLPPGRRDLRQAVNRASTY